VTNYHDPAWTEESRFRGALDDVIIIPLVFVTLAANKILRFILAILMRGRASNATVGPNPARDTAAFSRSSSTPMILNSGWLVPGHLHTQAFANSICEAHSEYGRCKNTEEEDSKVQEYSAGCVS
jgi:hypothetical protein